MAAAPGAGGTRVIPGDAGAFCPEPRCAAHTGGLVFKDDFNGGHCFCGADLKDIQPTMPASWSMNPKDIAEFRGKLPAVQGKADKAEKDAAEAVSKAAKAAKGGGLGLGAVITSMVFTLIITAIAFMVLRDKVPGLFLGRDGMNPVIVVEKANKESVCGEAGGWWVLTGVDTNRNNKWEDGESKGVFVCNGDRGPRGADGKDGERGPPGPRGPAGRGGSAEADDSPEERDTDARDDRPPPDGTARTPAGTTFSSGFHDGTTD